MKLEQIIESVPNFSEGRDLSKVEEIVDCFRAKPGVKLLDYSTDPDHNRCVVTVLGNPESLKEAMIEAVGAAVRLIDMTKHEGAHPRIGCVDVIPFIPVRDCTIEDADRLAKEVAKEAAERFGQPFYLYEKSASAPYRADLAAIRQGQFEGLAEKMKDPRWKPDFGPSTMHPTGGATAIGARMPLICFNVNLDTPNVEIARKISRRVRSINGGYRFVKAMGISLDERGLAQVTMNLTDYTKSSMYSVFEAIKMEARRYGARILNSEIVGTIPMQALVDCAQYYLQIDDFSIDQVLETHL
ncbi:glutamate formimidoyltransferase [Caproicibacterium sp. BJN0003]|uniref:glutamate formimidoyltransferase n=1 Tax=Caproicibacterium sp. BJN0003 TaxID=2994078 RepID=UPI0022529B26|nr:glutamate formimidoyltransferase [Caproicibacterium sp. BJN0003]UZT82407.1 glutamate formimidoyltransferase [Caproicibacterium sp. BJN0003]